MPTFRGGFGRETGAFGACPARNTRTARQAMHATRAATGPKYPRMQDTRPGFQGRYGPRRARPVCADRGILAGIHALWRVFGARRPVFFFCQNARFAPLCCARPRFSGAASGIFVASPRRRFITGLRGLPRAFRTWRVRFRALPPLSGPFRIGGGRAPFSLRRICARPARLRCRGPGAGP